MKAKVVVIAQGQLTISTIIRCFVLESNLQGFSEGHVISNCCPYQRFCMAYVYYSVRKMLSDIFLL